MLREVWLVMTWDRCSHSDYPHSAYASEEAAATMARFLESEYSRTYPVFDKWCQERSQLWRGPCSPPSDYYDTEDARLRGILGECPSFTGAESCDVVKVNYYSEIAEVDANAA